MGTLGGSVFRRGRSLGLRIFRGVSLVLLGLFKLRANGAGFAVFIFFSLAIVPVLIVRSLLKGARWPFYVLSGSMSL